MGRVAVDPESFDAKAATWDDAPHRVERARIAAGRIAQRVALDAGTRLLDYGAGTGLLAQHLTDQVGTVVLAEPSEGMRQVLEAKVAAGVLADATVLDLDLERSPAPDGLAVDVIVSLMVVHHLADIPTVLRRMRALLADGGQLCIVDLEQEDGSFHSSSFRGHHGLGREGLSRDMQAAGFAEPHFEHAFTMQKNGRDYDLFLATAAVA